MDETQKELPLPFPELSGDMPLLPARMVNEYQKEVRKEVRSDFDFPRSIAPNPGP